jgi:hypothetical protein
VGRRCDAAPTIGTVCQQCGREHKYLITGKVILSMCAAAAVGLLLWLYLTDQGRSFRYYLPDIMPYDFSGDDDSWT